ncbi:MAG TPA: hypothetical protein VLA27_10285 [Paracoccaceae bacterium]|nr:hypothetical protein [Paracoccaceae bacterium]
MAERQTNSDSRQSALVGKEDARISGTEVVALIASLVWLAGIGLFFLVAPADQTGLDSLRFILTLMVVFLPVAIIWVAAVSARSARIVREESQRLQIAVEALRKSYIADQRGRPTGTLQPSVERKLAEIAQTARQTEVALTTFTTHRDGNRKPVSPEPVPTDDQPSLALGTSVEDIEPPLETPDLIRALNFPDTESDEVGFSALRRALRDRQARQLVQASQDVLTLLSQDGIYMDDMIPDRARPEIWRRFAKGERGRVVAGLGGIRDRSSLALTAGRMREDTIFRDAAHHFLRKFDQMLVGLEPKASDAELVDLAETRTARAFMLLGRVAGTFD